MSETDIPQLPVEGANVSPAKGDEPKVSRWIRDLGAFVGVIAAAAGIYVGIQGLLEKANADENMAAATLEGERIKLKIALEQTAQHKADLDLEMRKNELEIERQERQTTIDQERLQRDTLASLITHMFTENGSSEGDIAVLFDRVDNKHENLATIENAALARLQSPRSKGEIELALRLLEHIGANALETLASANRSARQRYDDDLLTRFVELYNVRSETTSGNTLPEFLSFKDQIELLLSRFSYLNTQYDYATINSKTGILLGGAYPIKSKRVEDVVRDQDLAATVITRSSEILAGMLMKPHMPAGASIISLSGTYLSGGDWVEVPTEKVNYVGAYVDFSSLPSQERDQARLRFSGALSEKDNAHHGMVELEKIP